MVQQSKPYKIVVNSQNLVRSSTVGPPVVYQFVQLNFFKHKYYFFLFGARNQELAHFRQKFDVKILLFQKNRVLGQTIFCCGGLKHWDVFKTKLRKQR